MHRIRLSSALASLLALATSAAAQMTAPQWVQTFDGAASYRDVGNAIAIDAAGNAYVGGWSDWAPQGPGYYVPLFLLIKYSPQGVALWSRTWGSGYYGGNGVGLHVAIAPSGNIILSGQRDLGEDWVVLAYDPNGNQLWNRIWLADSWYVSSPSAMALDAAGNVFLGGDFGDPQTFQSRAAVVKVNADGSFGWVKVFDGTQGTIGSIRSLALGAGGEIFLTGASDVPGVAVEFSVAKLDPSGNPLWLRNHGNVGDPYANDYGVDIAVSSNGRVIAAGITANNVATGQDLALIAYDSSGALVWRFDHPLAQTQSIEELTLDPQGAAIVTGSTRVTSNDYDVLTAKVASNGQLAWSRSHGGVTFFNDGGSAVTADAQGNVFVAGDVVNTGNSEFLLLEYDALGALIASATWPAPNFGYAYAFDVALGPGDRVFLTGQSDQPNVENDATTMVFDRYGRRSYCTGKSNSAGCTPAVGWTGHASLSSSAPFTVRATQTINNKNGIFFYGTVGTAAAPFKGGTLCVQPPTRRTPLSNSAGNPGPDDCSGVLSLDFNAWLDSGADAALAAGDVIDGQFWYRDPASSFSAGLSDGVEFLVLP